MLILSLSVTITHLLTTELNSAQSKWPDKLNNLSRFFKNSLSLLALPLLMHSTTSLSERGQNMVLALLISSREILINLISFCNLKYPSSPSFSSPVRVLSGALRLSHKWNPNLRREKWWVEASSALLVFLLVIRLSADRPGVWRRWGLRGYNIGCLDAPGAPHSWDYLGQLKFSF